MFADLITLLLAVLPLASADIHTARGVRFLPNEPHAKRSVSLRGTVTFASPHRDYIYLQDDTGGVRVNGAGRHQLQPGERVRVIGNTAQGAFLPEVQAKFIATETDAGKRKPVPVDYTLTMDDAGYLDGQLVEAVVVVQRAWLHEGWLKLDLARGRGNAVAYIPLPEEGLAKKAELLKKAQALAGGVVKVRGVCRVDVQNRKISPLPQIMANDLDAIAKLCSPQKDPFGAAPMTVREVAAFRPDPIEGRKPVLVAGTVTLCQGDGRQLYVRDDTGMLHASLIVPTLLRPGDRVEVVGFPRLATEPQRLDNSQVRLLGPGQLPPPQPGTPAQASGGKLDGHVVKFTGTIHEAARQNEWMTLTVVSDGLTFTVLIVEPPGEAERTPWVPGSKIEVVGVVTREAITGIRRNSFVVFAKNASVKVLHVPVETPPPPPPSWWTGRRVAYLTAGFFGVFLLGGATVTVLRIQVRRATALVRKQYEEKEKLEGQLKLAAKLETVGRLAGGIAHDFNNLLTVINVCAELLTEEITKNPAKALGHTVEIQRAARQAASLTRQLLTFSRQRAVTPHPLDLNAVVTESAQVLVRLLGEKVAIHVAVEPDLPRAMAESSLLAQILLNLAVNARDAMPNGGTFILSTAKVEPGWVRLSAADTGVGMTSEVKAHIFEPFFTTKEVGRGTGLGLSTVYGIVQTLGGRIRFQSELGRGTTFEVDLPATDAPDPNPPRPPLAPLRLPMPPDPSTAETDLAISNDTLISTPPLPPAPPAPNRESPIVFLVEDDEAVRTLVRHVLEQAGMTVLTATGSDDAMRVLEDHSGPVDLLITDVVMPGLSGRQLAEQLRDSRPGLRVLFMSGYTSDEILLQGVREDQVEFLHKPFAPRDLIEQVRRILGQPV